MYFDDVYRYLLSLSGSESTAEELTSETFFRAMDALDHFRGECSVRVWLCQIAKNLYYSQLRREKCLAPLEDCRIAEESHEEELEDHSEAARIQELLHALREPYKEVFMWRVYGEKSFRDIGALFGKTENWACVTYHRAELDALKADVTPAPVSAQPLRDLKRQLRRKKLTAVLLAVTLALTLATAGFADLTAPQYLPYSETEWAISRSPSALADDGSAADGLSDLSGAESISVSLLVPVSGAEVTNTQDPNSGKTIYFITAWRTPLDTWRGAFDKTGGAPNTHSANDRTQREADALQGVLAKAESARTLFTLDAANCTAVCYSQNNGQDDVLLCGSMNGGIVSLPRLALGYYALLSLALLITLGIAFFVCRRKKTGKALGYLALIPASYLAGHLLVKGFTTTSYQMQRDFSLIILAAALIYAAVMLAINLWRQKREKV